jgi:two-component system NtrC family sensor kinase
MLPAHDAAPALFDPCSLADAVPHSIWVISASGTILYANSRAARPTPGAPWVSIVHPDDVAAVELRSAIADLQPEPYEVDCRVGRADGSFRRHRVSFAPVRDDGTALRWIATGTDIEETEALRDDLAEVRRRLAQTGTLLEALGAAVPCGLGFIDPGSRLVRTNDTLAAMGTVPRSQQLGRTADEVFPEIWAQIEANFHRAQATAEVVVGTVVTAPGDSGPRSWVVSCHPVYVDEALIGVGLVLIDVAERERAQAVRSAIMNDMADGLYTVDGEGRLTSMNRAASEMLGWQEAELLGKRAHSVMHANRANGTHRPESECVLMRLRTAGESAQAVADAFNRKDGSTFEVTCSIAPLDAGDGKPGSVITFRDMTDARRAELEIRHAQKLESLGRLSAGLAHEINTPIQFVGDNTRFLADACQDLLGLLRTYRECIATELGDVQWAERIRRAQAAEIKADVDYLTDEIPAAVDQSLEGVERVATLVRAMKTFSYKGSAAPERADLNEAVRTTLTVARNEVKYVADVVLELGELPDVLCHLSDLNQVFLNLLVNAADAVTEKGGRGEIRISSALDGPTVVITFADNGTGIPEDVQPSIFEPFFTTKGVGKGTGQGLPLAGAVMKKHGGSIEMSSTPGEGTVFTLRLPIDGRPA